MTESDLLPLLQSIAASLERLAPKQGAAPDLWAADAFVWHSQGEWLEPIHSVNRVDIDLLRGIDRAPGPGRCRAAGRYRPPLTLSITLSHSPWLCQTRIRGPQVGRRALLGHQTLQGRGNGLQQGQQSKSVIALGLAVSRRKNVRIRFHKIHILYNYSACNLSTLQFSEWPV